MVHTIVIACRQSEKILDSIMKRHGNHVKQKEYEIQGGEERIAMILNTIARVEEVLHAMPFDNYDRLLTCVEGLLDTSSDGVDELKTLQTVLACLVDFFARILRTTSLEGQKSAKKVYQRISVLATVYNRIDLFKHRKKLVEFSNPTWQIARRSEHGDTEIETACQTVQVGIGLHAERKGFCSTKKGNKKRYKDVWTTSSTTR